MKFKELIDAFDLNESTLIKLDRVKLNVIESNDLQICWINLNACVHYIWIANQLTFEYNNPSSRILSRRSGGSEGISAVCGFVT